VAHVETPVLSEVLRLDDATDAVLSAARGIGFEDVVFYIERGDLLDILNTRTPAVTPASASS
jgi:hypothetical protein